VIASLLFRASYRRFLAACHRPREEQARRLRRVLAGAATTEFGRAHDFAALARVSGARALIAAYRNAVPVRPWRETQPDLDAVYAGNWRRLCPSRPLCFTMTAGSTGRFKYLPVTPELRRDLGRASLAFYGAIEAAFPALRRRAAQFLVGSAEGGTSPDGIPQGFASGFNYKALPGFVRRKFVLPYWIFTLGDAEDRAYAAGRILAERRDLGVLCAISPVNLINVMAALQRNAERLVADLRAGTLTVRSRAAVPGRYRTSPNRPLADALERARRTHGALPVSSLFPSLELLVCWRGGNMGYYLDDLAEHFGPRPVFEFPLSASEGVFAIPHRPGATGGIAAVTSHYLEFVPEDAAGGGATARGVDELEEGATYRLVITTSGGLYRYDMEDLVRVAGSVARTPVLAFVSRANRQVSVANERITECDVTEAMTAASRVTGLRVPEFLFVPCSDRRYRLLVDGAALDGAARDPARPGAFAREVERQLRASAKGYDFEREDGLLDPLVLVVTAPGELRRYLASCNGAPNLPSAQHKPMHLTPEFDAHRRLTAAASHAA
jgi:hypothetical protein